MPRLTLLPLLAITALIALVGSGMLLVAGWGSSQLAAYLAFALGVMPLILAAMGYFVPVLTRSSPPGFAAWGPPMLAWIGGALAVGVFATSFSPTGLGLAALVALLAAAALGGWMLVRAQRMFGPRHRGLDWYLGALGFLLLALLAVILMPWFPGQRSGLRLFHLHANLLGFVGLTALGTLQVLLPTCLRQSDPGVAIRLRGDLKWAAGGALLIAFGASSLLPAPLVAFAAPLALLGVGLYGLVVLRMLSAWTARFGTALLRVDGAAPSLAAAAIGLFGMLVLGAAHGAGWGAPRPLVAGFVIAFLLPLVGGAASHPLPVWLRPGAQGPWHDSLRARLVRWGGIRGLLLLLAGLALSLYRP